MGRTIASGLLKSGKVEALTGAGDGPDEGERREGREGALRRLHDGERRGGRGSRPRDPLREAEGHREGGREPPGRRQAARSSFRSRRGSARHSWRASSSDETPVLRAMPNTPCLIGKGMTVLAKGSHATDDHIALATEVFAPLGRVLELEEKHMDTVTGLSASGPAFIYIIIEALADGGRHARAAAQRRDDARGPDDARRGGDGPHHRAPSRGAQGRRDDTRRLHDRRHPRARGRTHPVGLARGVETAARVAGEPGK